jgi:hypothetical protein
MLRGILNPPTSGQTRMEQHVTVLDDLKTAGVLAGSAGLFGAVTVPTLLPAAFELVPPDQRALPMPMPLFCVLLAIQFLVVYGLFALAGLRIARARQLEPAPLLTGSGQISVQTKSDCALPGQWVRGSFVVLALSAQ